MTLNNTKPSIYMPQQSALELGTTVAETPASMPPRAPLPMPIRDLGDQPQSGPPVPLVANAHTGFFRAATFLPSLITTGLLIFILSDWFSRDGFTAMEMTMLGLAGFCAFWIALSVAGATIGLVAARSLAPFATKSSQSAMQIALLVPIYREPPEAVFRRIHAMRKELALKHSLHHFAFFVLSDTNDEDLAESELAIFLKQQVNQPGLPPLYYRRRTKNLERKTGNIRQWIESWGADWDAFVTLDADSLMGASPLIALADDMVQRPDTALIQSVPRLLGANTLFSRGQQFSNNVYGRVLSRGLKRWSGTEGNYWGHNAIIRTDAFAQCCGLPRLSGGGALGGTIKSHDFVEAALLRRAGWAVRIAPALEETYEETPQTIVDYILRDRRWCQGNLQHLRVLATRGFTATSRFHMFQGAMAYIASLAWFFLLIVWALMGRGEDANVFVYFTDTNPLFPQWPEMDAVSKPVVLAFMAGLLLLPKFFGYAAVLKNDLSARAYGGPLRFTISTILEVGLSVIIAPIMMIQHVLGVGRALANRDTGWAPQNREGKSYGFATLVRFHAVETVIGGLLIVGMIFGVVSAWLLPIAISLAFAVFISWVLSQPLSELPLPRWILTTREYWMPSQIIRSACPDRDFTAISNALQNKKGLTARGEARFRRS